MNPRENSATRAENASFLLDRCIVVSSFSKQVGMPCPLCLQLVPEAFHGEFRYLSTDFLPSRSVCFDHERQQVIYKQRDTKMDRLTSWPAGSISQSASSEHGIRKWRLASFYKPMPFRRYLGIYKFVRARSKENSSLPLPVSARAPVLVSKCS